MKYEEDKDGRWEVKKRGAIKIRVLVEPSQQYLDNLPPDPEEPTSVDLGEVKVMLDSFKK